MRAATLLIVLVCACGPVGKTGPDASAASPSPRRHTLERADLSSAFASSSAATYRVRYSVNGAINGEAISGTWATYQKPPARRVDVAYGGIAAYQSQSVF